MAKANGATSDREFVRRVLIVIGLVALAYLAWELRAVLVMLFGAIVVATVFRSVADPICRWTGLPSGVTVAIAIAIVFLTIAGLIALFGAQVGDQVQLLSTALPEAWKALESRISNAGLGEQLRAMLNSAKSSSSGMFANVGRVLMSIGNGVADTLVVIFGGIFLAAQPRFYKTGAVKLFPEGKRELIGTAMDDSERALRLWLKGQLIAMLAVGLFTGIGLWFLGMESALALGLLAGLLEFIPFAGPIIAAIPALLIALAVDPQLALSVVILYVVVQQLEGAVLQPMVQQYAVDLPGVILLFSLIAFGILFGVVGIIFAAPLAVVSYVMVKKLYVQETLGTPTPIPGEDNGS